MSSLKKLGQLVAHLQDADAPIWDAELGKFLDRRPCWPVVSTEAPQAPADLGLLEPIGSISLEVPKRFIAKSKFVENTAPGAHVKIRSISDNFKAWFLRGKGKIEKSSGKINLRYAKLLKRSVDGRILTALGGRDKAKASLAAVWALLAKQPNGEPSGALLVNDYWPTIFYVESEVIPGEDKPSSYINEEGKRVVLRAAYVSWFVDGWDVDACSVEGPVEWYAAYRVFSRNSC